MAGIFGRFKGSSANASTPGPNTTATKKPDGAPEITPLEKMLQNAGPLRPDGTDKFFGMENFGNTCYCNSIVQALYYSTPFRENVVKYPPHSPDSTPNGHIIAPRALNGTATAAPAAPKGITAAEALRRRAAINSGNPQTVPGTRPEDKPDTPEYKKKHAMLKGPILDLTYENANSWGMEESTFTALKDIFVALIASQSRTGVLSPQRFLEIFKRDNEMFRTSMHQDAHEFYGLVLNAVITNVEESARMMKQLAPPQNDSGLAATAMTAVTSAVHAMGLSSGARSPGTGWVHEIFEGVLTSETKCLTCETASQRDETFLDLSIDLEQHSSVTSCLRKFSAEEMLCERNKFHCDNCGGLQEAEKRMKIKRLPKILALHLKRFKYTEDMTRLQKLFHRVVYPYHLRMFNTTDDAEDPDRLYELYAVVVHIGGNAYHGHYVSVIKTKERGWLLFDDEMVEPVDKHYVRNFFGDKPGMACAYVLFYQETTLEAVQKEQEAEGLAEAALASQEAGIALGGHMAPNGVNGVGIHGINGVSSPNTPIEETENEFTSLDHAATAPQPIPIKADPALYGTSPSNALLNHALTVSPKSEVKPKEQRERDKKEAKEAEKARKAAEKEKAKALDKRRKELEQKRKEQMKLQTEEWKLALEASKLSAAEEEARRKTEGGAAVATPTSAATDKKENGFLSRNHKGHRSMSRKSLGWLGGARNTSEPLPKDTAVSSPSPSTPSADTAVEGIAGPQTPEKHEKPKERFSFSLGKKKSSLNFPS